MTYETYHPDFYELARAMKMYVQIHLIWYTQQLKFHYRLQYGRKFTERPISYDVMKLLDWHTCVFTMVRSRTLSSRTTRDSICSCIKVDFWLIYFLLKYSIHFQSRYLTHLPAMLLLLKKLVLLFENLPGPLLYSFVFNSFRMSRNDEKLRDYRTSMSLVPPSFSFCHMTLQKYI